MHNKINMNKIYHIFIITTRNNKTVFYLFTKAIYLHGLPKPLHSLFFKCLLIIGAGHSQNRC
jgi:hypothetical protein